MIVDEVDFLSYGEKIFRLGSPTMQYAKFFQNNINCAYNNYEIPYLCNSRFGILGTKVLFPQ